MYCKLHISVLFKSIQNVKYSDNLVYLWKKYLFVIHCWYVCVLVCFIFTALEVYLSVLLKSAL